MMRLTSAGKLGIGIASPSATLDVLGQIRVGSDASGADEGTGTCMWNAAGGDAGIAAYQQMFYTGNNGARVERMRITNGGNVGIGITNPSYKLVVSDGGAAGFEFDPTASTPLLQVYNRSTLAYSNLQVSAATIRFFTGATPAEAARIDGNKYLLVGYTASNGAYPLQVNGQIFATNATIATSDGRYKKDVREISGGLDLVAALRPVAFRWKSHPVHNFDLAGEQVGFIAQEVQAVLDKATFRDGIVKGNRVKVERGGKDRTGRVLEDGVDEEFFGLAEGKLIPLLVCAVKELKAIVDAQADRIAALEAK
jgi:hypothetical protein